MRWVLGVGREFHAHCISTGFGRIPGHAGIREFTRIKSTAEMVMSIPMNMMSFRQPKDMTKTLRSMIKQLYGDGVVAKATDTWRRFRSGR